MTSHDQVLTIALSVGIPNLIWGVCFIVRRMLRCPEFNSRRYFDKYGTLRKHQVHAFGDKAVEVLEVWACEPMLDDIDFELDDDDFD